MNPVLQSLVGIALAGLGPRAAAQRDGSARLAALLNRLRPASTEADLALLERQGSITAVGVIAEAGRRDEPAALARAAVATLARLARREEVRRGALDELTTLARRAPLAAVRRAALDALAARTDSREALRKVLAGTRDQKIRRAALAALARGGWDASVRRLCLRLLLDPDEDEALREAAFDAAPAGALKLEHLLALFGEAPAGLRRRALARLQKENPAQARRLARGGLLDTNAAVRLRSARILVAGGVAAEQLQALDRACTGDNSLRYAVVDALVASPHPGFLSGLERRLREPDLKRRQARVYLAVLRGRALAGEEGALRILRRGLRLPDTWVRIGCARALGEARDRGSREQLQRLLRSAYPSVRIEGMVALSAVVGRDDRLAKRLAGMLDDPLPEVRVAAVDCLAAMGERAVAGKLLELLEEGEFAVRIAALEALVRLRYAPAIPVLIEDLARAHGRFVEDYARGLRLLTGQPFRRFAPDWRRWWRDHGEGFVPPPLDEAQKQELAFRQRERAAPGGTSSFYGIEVISDRVVFVIDQSGSMRGKAATHTPGGKAKTRLQVAKEELARYIERVPAEHRFDIVLFGTGVSTWSDTLRSPRGAIRAKATKWVRSIRIRGATNLYGAIRKAFSFAAVDTIYLLSDGEPSVGEETRPAEIIAAVRAWNRERKIVIHGISIGTRSALLRELAAMTGGNYVIR